MRAYVKETGQELHTSCQRVHDKLPRGKYVIVLRNTDQEIPLKKRWDGGQTEITMVVKRTGQYLNYENGGWYRIEWPPLRHGGVHWDVSEGGYKTKAFKYDIDVLDHTGEFHTRHEKPHFYVSFMDASTKLPVGPMARVLPQALEWAKGVIDDLYQHASTVKFTGKPVIKPKNPQVLTRFDLIREDL